MRCAREQARDRERHRDAVIAAAVDRAAAHAAAGDSAHRRAAPRPRCRRVVSPCAMTASRSVSFLRSSSAPLTIVSPARSRRRDEQDRELVDRERHELGRHVDPRELALRDPEIGDRLAADAALRFAARCRRPSRAGSSSRPVRVGLMPTFSISSPSRAPMTARDEEERRRAEVGRHADLAAAQRRGSVERHRMPCAVGRHCSSRTPMLCSMRSVWSRLGPGERSVVAPLGAERREQQRRLDLRARDRQRVVDAASARRRPCATGGRPPPTSSMRAPIEPQRRGDSLHRALPQRRIARELAVERLAGEQTRSAAGCPCRSCRGRATLRGRAQPARSDAFDSRRSLSGVRVDGDAHAPRAPLGSRDNPRSRETHERPSSLRRSRRASARDARSTCRRRR